MALAQFPKWHFVPGVQSSLAMNELDLAAGRAKNLHIFLVDNFWWLALKVMIRDRKLKCKVTRGEGFAPAIELWIVKVSLPTPEYNGYVLIPARQWPLLWFLLVAAEGATRYLVEPHTSCSMGEKDRCVETAEYMIKRNVRTIWS